MVELDLTGGKYTWEKSRGTTEWVRERLDRAFASYSWWHLFPLCKLRVIHTIYSDHDPIQVDLYSTEHSKRNFRFRFENVWLKEKKFHDEVAQYWKALHPTQFIPKLLELSTFMGKLGRKFFNKFREKIQKQKSLVALFEDCVDEQQTKRYFEERGKLEDLLIQEETYWKQRAKSFWLLEGDSNSKYFHAYATTRKRKNFVHYLKSETGEVISDQEGMCNAVEDYFKNVFSQSGDLVEEDADFNAEVITMAHNNRLTAYFTMEEFSSAIKEMHPDKSAGPDGLNPAFFSELLEINGK